MQPHTCIIPCSPCSRKNQYTWLRSSMCTSGMSRLASVRVTPEKTSQKLKSRLSVPTSSNVKSIWNFAQCTAVQLPCTVQNCKMISRVELILWMNKQNYVRLCEILSSRRIMYVFSNMDVVVASHSISSNNRMGSLYIKSLMNVSLFFFGLLICIFQMTPGKSSQPLSNKRKP